MQLSKERLRGMTLLVAGKPSEGGGTVINICLEDLVLSCNGRLNFIEINKYQQDNMGKLISWRQARKLGPSKPISIQGVKSWT